MLRSLFLAAVLVVCTQAAKKKTSATFCTKYSVDDAGGDGVSTFY